MIFFLDENTPKRAVDLLEAFDTQCEVRHLLGSFDQGTADTVWMRALAQWSVKPIVVCGDGRILRSEEERAVLRDCDLMFVFLEKGWTNLSWNEFAWRIVKVWPKIGHEVSHVLRPTVFSVNYSSLKVTNWGFTADRR